MSGFLNSAELEEWREKFYVEEERVPRLRERREMWHRCRTDIFFLKHASSILRQSFNPLNGSSMIEQVRLCAVWPTKNWLGSPMKLIQGWKTV